MTNTIIIEDLITIAEKANLEKELPDVILKQLISSPQIIIELLQYYIGISHHMVKRENACLYLISRCLDEIRYSIDRKSENAKLLFDEISTLLIAIYNKEDASKLSQLSAILYESHLPFMLPDNILAKNTNDKIEIMPKLPELLEQTRRQNRIRSSFELYEGLMSQLQIMSANINLIIAGELAMTKKSMPHEVAIMMLLHLNDEVRKKLPAFLMNVVDKKIFTPIDLRRLIVIRNWVPASERPAIDELIKAIRLQGISSAPYPVSRIDSLMASVFDGAGAQIVFFMVKQASTRVIGGFILKHGVGIREPWIDLKAGKANFDALLENCTIDHKPVTMAYVNKAVKHFLTEGHKQGNVPSPLFLQIAEILGVSEWQAESINIPSELTKIEGQIDIDIKDLNEVMISLERSGNWHRSESFFKYWFECGDIAHKQLLNAIETHKKMTGKNSMSLEAIVIQEVMQPAIEKWKNIIFFMALWARSKIIKNPLWLDLLILFNQLESGADLNNIPAIRNIAAQSAASMLMHAKR